MERSDGTAIESMLRELRPAPRPEFAAELDARSATGFAHGQSRVARALSQLRAMPPRRTLAPAAVSTLVAIAVATALVSTNNRDSVSAVSQGHPHGSVQFSEPPPSSAETEAGGLSSASAGLAHKATPSIEASGLARRDIERSATITLLADPEDVAGDSSKVFAAVHDAHGIVLHSYTTRGPSGQASANFALLIPSVRLGDTLSALSSIDEVGSRNDSTADITAPTVTVTRRLHESRTQIDNLLSQLATAETEAERETLEVQLRSERRQAAALESQLTHLRRRVHYSHLSVRIETGRSSASAGGAWGIDDAVGSARHILSVAAGVTLVGLAVLAPVFLLALLIWLAHRTWLRFRRERALS